MAMTNVELYEALKEPVGEKAARLIAEVFPAARDLATKQDIDELRHATKQDIEGLRHATKQDIDELRHATKQDIEGLKHDVDELKHATKSDIGLLDARLSRVEGQMRILITLSVTLVGTMLASMGGIIATLLVKG